MEAESPSANTPSSDPSSGPDAAQPGSDAQRLGDPLEGLWHWTDHPAARVGIVIAVLLGSLVLFPVLAQWMF